MRNFALSSRAQRGHKNGHQFGYLFWLALPCNASLFRELHFVKWRPVLKVRTMTASHDGPRQNAVDLHVVADAKVSESLGQSANRGIDGTTAA